MIRSWMPAALAILLATLNGCGKEDPAGRRVLVVYAADSLDSIAVAQYYARARHVPQANLCGLLLRKPSEVFLSTRVYESSVKTPVENCLKAVGTDKILYIVLAYLRPFQIDPGDGLHYYALDSYLADIWDFYSDKAFAPLPNRYQPYYTFERPSDHAVPAFVSFAQFRDRQDAPMIYSVWRLDGPTAAMARSMVDKAIRTEAAHGPAGQACIDEQSNPEDLPDEGYRAGDWDLHRAAQFLGAAGFKVLEDQLPTELGTPPSGNCPNAALYAGWYTLKHYNDAFTWVEGAIGFHMDSASAIDPREGESWSVNAIKRGITVTSGAMGEPYLVGLPRPDGIFYDLLAGANVGDAFLRNTRFLKWRILNIGDPLYRPFPGGKKEIGPRMHANARE